MEDVRRMWEARILDTLDRRPNKKCDYVLLRSDQVSLDITVQIPGETDADSTTSLLGQL